MTDLVDTTGKVAEAVGSSAKALERPLETASKFMEALGMPTATELGLAAADIVRHFRQRNLKRLNDRFQRKLEERNIVDLPLPEPFLLTAANHAANVEDDDL